MDPFAGPCPHRSVPVEMDESMSPSSLDLAWPPPCHRCGGQVAGGQQSHRGEDHCRVEPTATGHTSARPPFAPPSGRLDAVHSAAAWPFGEVSASLKCPQEFSVEEVESLEPPLPLMSDVNRFRRNLAPHPVTGPPRHYPGPGQGARPGQCLHHGFDRRLQPECGGAPHQRPPPHPQQQQQQRNSPQNHGGPHAAPLLPRGVMGEVSVGPSLQADRGHQVTGETRRTISLPEESRNLFITYSLDTAREMVPFTKFLTDQGFRPAIDIFDNPIRRMDITRWMDRFLKDKSVLIIVVISPKYKEDVEGEGDDDEHGLHTKYIHNQLQDEFIRMGCRNFRLVPVLFSSATKRDVPSWLQSTRIYRWPADVQDLLLRLVREERYIIPPARGDLTITVRPL